MSAQAPFAVGLDFGTTNTVVAISPASLGETGSASVLPFKLRSMRSDQVYSTFRSAMCFWEEDHNDVLDLRFEAGPWAIERFIDDPTDCRFLQSFKTFAASPLFSDTFIHGRKFTFEQLLAAFLDKLRVHSDGQLANLPKRLVMGRPVAFAGANADEALALARYERALRELGVEEIVYVYEPVAAAYFFAQRLTSAATVLVADFGGGTSDFSIIRFEPSESGLRSIPLSHSGVAVAGDVFDYRILEHAILPQLGYRAAYKSIDKLLEVPTHYHHRFAQWSQLALMKSPKVLRELREYWRYAVERDGLAKFLAIIENDLGYPLYKAVADAKTALSSADSTKFSFAATGGEFAFTLEETIERAAFESWIADDLAAIDDAVEQALTKAGIVADQVDRVFLTGGSSFVPAVRALFERRFNPEKLETGDQLESIAYGLALIAALDEPAAWSA